MTNILSYQVQYFLKCCETLSLSKAATELGVTQSGLSLAIKRLEEGLSLQLFERKAGRKEMQITAKGEILRAKLLKLQATTVEELSILGSPAFITPLRIGVSMHLGAKYLNPLLTDKKIALKKFHIFYLRAAYVQDAVRTGSLDFGFASLPAEPKGVERQFVKNDTIRWVGLKSTFPEIMKAKSVQDLSALPQAFERQPYDTDFFSKIPMDQSGYMIDDHFSIRNLILNGLVVADMQLDYFTNEELKTLAIAPFTPAEDHYKIYFFWRKNLESEKLALVEDLCKTIKSAMK